MSPNLDQLRGQLGGGAHVYAPSLRWIGGNIVRAGDDIFIAVQAPNGTVVSLSLAGTLALANKVDARRLYHIITAVHYAFTLDELSRASAAV